VVTSAANDEGEIVGAEISLEPGDIHGSGGERGKFRSGNLLDGLGRTGASARSDYRVTGSTHSQPGCWWGSGSRGSQPARTRPSKSVEQIAAPELAAFSAAAVDVAGFQRYLSAHNLALIVSRDVTTRDHAIASNRTTCVSLARLTRLSARKREKSMTSPGCNYFRVTSCAA